MNLIGTNGFGPLRRGDVRADGKIFWAYGAPRKRSGIRYECWLYPETFERSAKLDARRLKRLKRLKPNYAIEVVRQWRKDNPKKYVRQINLYAKDSSARRLEARNRKSFLVLLRDLAGPQRQGRGSPKWHLRVELTPARARKLLKWLKERVA